MRFAMKSRSSVPYRGTRGTHRSVTADSRHQRTITNEFFKNNCTTLDIRPYKIEGR